MFKRLKGFTLIELLIVVAIIAILAAIAVPNFLEAQVRSKVSRARSDMRSMATAIESYYVDNNLYPVVDSSQGADQHLDGIGANFRGQAPEYSAALRSAPTFATNDIDDPARQFMTLTTPVAYVSTYFADPFAEPGATYNFSVSGLFRDGWIIWSYGPDADSSTVHGTITNVIDNSASGAGGDVWVTQVNKSGEGKPPTVAETHYNPAQGGVQDALLLLTYDPTNGSTSDGDVYRIKE